MISCGVDDAAARQSIDKSSITECSTIQTGSPMTVHGTSSRNAFTDRRASSRPSSSCFVQDTLGNAVLEKQTLYST